jgi:hypothetical protein
MTKRAVSFMFVFHVLFVGIIIAYGQSATISRAELLTYMGASEKATKGIPYRVDTTVEMSERQNGPWSPYSSWFELRIAPDRWHITYLSGPSLLAGIPSEYIRVGRTKFAKDRTRGWAQEQAEVVGVVVNPASTPGFNGPVVRYELLDVVDEFIDPNMKAVRVVSGKTADLDISDKETLTYVYVFDDHGILKKTESYSYNGTKWIRRRESIEYDPTIKIEAPIP